MTDLIPPKDATAPPPLPTERNLEPVLPPPGAREPHATGGLDQSGSLWAMSPSDRVLPPDAVAPPHRPGRGLKLGIAAAVAIVAGVMLVEMVRRSPQPPPQAVRKEPQSTAVAIEAVKRASPPVSSIPAQEDKALAVPSSQPPAGATAVAPPPAVPGTAAAALPQVEPVQPAATVKEPAKAPSQTGSLPAVQAKTPAVAPKVLNAPAATSMPSATKPPPAAPVAGAPVRSPGGRTIAPGDAHSPAMAGDLPPVRPATPDATAEPGAEREDQRGPRAVASAPVVGAPIRTQPRPPHRDDYLAGAPPRGTDADYYARQAPPPLGGNEQLAPAEPPRRFRTSSRPIPPPNVDSRDPYQVRAMSVGLHPQTPPDVLRRLSNADYRNADVAIQTALAETPDGRLFVWPREEIPGQATYLVRVGRGIEPGCRRYMVKIEKEGRTVTTPEMETCSGR